MNRTLKRKQALQQKKDARKLKLTPASTGLTVPQLKQLQQVMMLANTTFAARQFQEAEKCCRLALSIYPKYADPYHLLGGIALEFDKYDEAVIYLGKALEVAPNSPITLNNYGIALKHQNRHEDALKALTKSLKLKSNYFEALNNKGSVLSVLGKVQEAIPFYEKAAKVNPLFGKAYYNLATAHKFKVGDAYSKLFEKMEPHLPDMTEQDQMNFHFALGKYYEDLKDYKTGIEHYLKANQLKKATLNYSVDTAEKMMDGMSKVFSIGGDWVERTEVGCQSDVPIFILGMPRSGTTLVEQILASHPKVCGAGELKLTNKVMSGLTINNKEIFPPDPKESAAFEKDIRERGEAYVREIRQFDPNAPHITDKMPQNFRHLGLIHLILPKAKIIHCRRNPVDTCLSNFRILFGEKMEYTYDLEEVGRYYVAYSKLTEHWKKALPDRFLDVHYEDVVGDIETQAKRLISHCGLEWDDACLDFHKTKRNVHTASTTQVRQPIYNSSVGRYERYGDLLKPLLKVLGPVL